MLPHVRADIAYIAGRLMSGRDSTSIYDFGNTRYIPIGGKCAESSVNIYDYEQCACISGDGNGTRYSLYHYGEKCYLDLTIEVDGFKGYDYGARCFFSGRVSDKTISFYDYETGDWFNYSI